MPITVNVGGVLHQLTGVYGNDGGIVKPIGGFKKEDMTLHWGGFIGEGSDQIFLIGEFTIDFPVYFNTVKNCDDNFLSSSVTPTDDVLSRIKNTISYTYDNTKDVNFIYQDNATLYLKNSKNQDISEYYHRVISISTIEYTRNATTGIWSLTKNIDNEYYSSTSKPLSLPEGKYYVYVNKCSHTYIKFYGKSNTNSTVNRYSTTNEYLPMDGMAVDYTLKFQTLNLEGD